MGKASDDDQQLAPRIANIGHGTNPSFCDNAIRTSKYTALNFIPKNLFTQFRRQANIYFLLQSFLMFLGTYAPHLFQSPVSPWSTFGTLAAVMSVTLAKDGIEDLSRHRSDQVENTSEVAVIREHQLVTTTKRDLRVGDIVVVNNFESVPADMICICSSSPVGTCYVETANIDGETNLKIRKVTEALREALPDIAAVVGTPGGKSLSGSFQCEAPNQHIHSFSATLKVDGANGDENMPMSINNLLIRGSVVRNTKWVAGVVM
jgi:magnesium-transporting ATPase (P-type)